MNPAAVAEIHTNAIARNVEAIRKRTAPGTPLCVAVKADAYGHGVAQVLPVLAEARVERLAVAQIDEALELRELGWTASILCMGAPLAGGEGGDAAGVAREAVTADVTCTVSSPEEAAVLGTEAARMNAPGRAEVKVDTGMGRMGVLADGAFDVIAAVAATRHVTLEGVYTHFASADEADLTFAREQLAAFTALARRVREAGVPVGSFHGANSAAIFRLPESHLDLVRPGLGTYGYWGGPADERPADLVPAMRVVSRLVAVRDLPAGHPVGYGSTWRAARDSRIGVVPVGYGDGYRRRLSGDAVMTMSPVRDQPLRRVPVVGRVSMDLTSVDLTDAGDVRVGDPVVVIDDDPAAPNSVEALARRLDTIPYEITCLIGRRIHRRAV